MPQITVTVPAPAVQEPTTAYTTDINVTANAGQNYANAPLGSIQNNGNDPAGRDLKITVDNIVGGSLQNIGIKDQNGDMQYSSTSPHQINVPAGASTEVLIIFDVIPPTPGGADDTVTADLTSEWV